ncbi:MAG: MFS transporter [Burkholderiales bacterium]
MTAPDAANPDSLFAQPGYRRFWIVRLGSQLAMQMLAVAVGWQMYELTGSAWDLGLVGLAEFLPALLLALPAGHAADRYDRARIVTLVVLLQTLIAVTLLAGSLGGWVSRELILGLAAALGLGRAFQMPAIQSITPLLVDAHLLPRAMAANSSALQLAVIAGPALGGLLFALGASVTYAVCAAVSLLSGVLMLGLKLRPAPRSTEPASWRTLLAGVAYIRQRPVLLGAISLDLFAVLLGGAVALLPIFAKDLLHVGPVGLGLLRGAPAVGALAMSLWLARHPIEGGAGHKLFAAVALYGVAMLVFALSGSFLLSLAALALSGAVDLVSVVIRLSMVQLETPNEMRGRVNAVNSVFIGASNQLGEFESGVTAAWLGPVGSVLLGGMGTLVVCALWIRLFPSLWRRDRLLESHA